LSSDHEKVRKDLLNGFSMTKSWFFNNYLPVSMYQVLADEQKKLHPDCWKRKRSMNPPTPTSSGSHSAGPSPLHHSAGPSPLHHHHAHQQQSSMPGTPTSHFSFFPHHHHAAAAAAAAYSSLSSLAAGSLNPS